MDAFVYVALMCRSRRSMDQGLLCLVMISQRFPIPATHVGHTGHATIVASGDTRARLLHGMVTTVTRRVVADAKATRKAIGITIPNLSRTRSTTTKMIGNGFFQFLCCCGCRRRRRCQMSGMMGVSRLELKRLTFACTLIPLTCGTSVTSVTLSMKLTAISRARRRGSAVLQRSAGRFDCDRASQRGFHHDRWHKGQKPTKALHAWLNPNDSKILKVLASEILPSSLRPYKATNTPPERLVWPSSSKFFSSLLHQKSPSTACFVAVLVKHGRKTSFRLYTNKGGILGI